jgi:hypothetical protein
MTSNLGKEGRTKIVIQQEGGLSAVSQHEFIIFFGACLFQFEQNALKQPVLHSFFQSYEIKSLSVVSVFHTFLLS